MCALLFCVCSLLASFIISILIIFNFKSLRETTMMMMHGWKESRRTYLSQTLASSLCQDMMMNKQIYSTYIVPSTHYTHSSALFSSLVLWSIIIKEFLVFFSFWLNYLDKFFVQTHFSLLKEMMWNVCIVIGHVHPLFFALAAARYSELIVLIECFPG